MTKQKEIEEGIEIILFDNSIKGPKRQKNFTELAKDIMRMESDKGVVIKGKRDPKYILYEVEPLIEE